MCKLFQLEFQDLKLVVHEDEDQAEDLVTDLASMMRYVLDSSSTHVTLAQELDVVERLLRIEKARLGDRLRYAIDLDPSVASPSLPGLLVQPLVENAVQHGIARRTEGGTVRVQATRGDDAVHIGVEDDGQGPDAALVAALTAPLTDDTHPGGLRNVVERVRLGWPDGSAFLAIEGARLTLSIPLASP